MPIGLKVECIINVPLHVVKHSILVKTLFSYSQWYRFSIEYEDEYEEANRIVEALWNQFYSTQDAQIIDSLVCVDSEELITRSDSVVFLYEEIVVD